MSSDIQSTLEIIRFNDCISLVLVTAVIYDYFLTLSKEVAYVWSRRWTNVSTMFVLVRYAGLSWVILNGLCTIVFLAVQWVFVIFYNVADFVMILRVYAMWNRSKKILYFLLPIYVLQVLCIIASASINANPNGSQYLSVTVVQIGGVTFCNYALENIPSKFEQYASFLQVLFGSLLLVLAAGQTIKEALEMYKLTKQWQPNRYIKQFTRDGILYFLANLFFNVTAVAVFTVNSNIAFLLQLFSCISIFPLMPRFIINVRELYDREACGGWEGIDTGFGVLSQARSNEHISAISFADGVLQQDDSEVGAGAGADELGTIRLEPYQWGDDMREV